MLQMCWKQGKVLLPVLDIILEILPGLEFRQIHSIAYQFGAFPPRDKLYLQPGSHKMSS